MHGGSRGPVHAWVAEVARARPDAPALTGDDERWTYGRLCEAGSALAHRLNGIGVGPDDVVALHAPRGGGAIAAILGILRAGGAYMPVDPTLPKARIARILDNAAPRAIVAARSLRDVLDVDPKRVVLLDDAVNTSGVGVGALDDHLPALRPDHLAYVLHTSGTSGTPKAVLQTHQTLENLIGGLASMGISADRATTLQYAPLSFDVSIQELATAWRTGSELILVPSEERADPERLLDRLERHRVQRLFMPPAVLSLLAEVWHRRGLWDLSALTEIVSAGEALVVTEPLAALVGDRIRLVNEYGPTETHVATAHVVRDLTPGARPPIGRPLPGFRVHVLDGDGAPVAAGAPGELWIAGEGVARGYLRRDEETAARFAACAGESRAYRTGDVVRVSADGDGELVYLGRVDAQLKVRGYRVEPGEVEQVLLGVHGVSAAVVLGAVDPSGAAELTGWFVGDADEATVADALRAELPDYLVPAHLVRVAALPVTPHGKIDREHLPAPRRAVEPGGAPVTDGERALHAIWCEVLGRGSIGVDEDLVEAGGDSLKAVRLAWAIEARLGRRVPLAELIGASTIRRLAARFAGPPDAAGDADDWPVLTPDREHADAPFPLTEVQRAYWLGRSQAALARVGTHTYAELRVSELDVAALERAWNRVVARHDLLRAVVTADGEQRVLPRVPWYAVPVADLRGASFATREASLTRVRDALSHQLFSGHAWPMFELRASLLDDGAIVHISLDALVVDLSSLNRISRELSALYLEPERALPELGIGYRDYVLAVRSLLDTERYRRARSYWLGRRDTLPGPPELPFARDPASIADARFERHTSTVDPLRWTRLKAEAARMRVSATSMVAGCFAEVLAGWSAPSSAFTLNLTLFHRIPLHPDVGQLVGDFTSLSLLEVPLDARPFRARLEALQRTLWEDLEHRWFGGVEVQRALAERGRHRGGFPVVFTSALGLDDDERPAPFDVYPAVRLTQTPQVWLDCLVAEVDGALVCNLDSVVGLFPDGVIARVAASLEQVLISVADQPLALDRVRLDVVPAMDRALVAAVNRTAAERPGGLLHHGLLAHARRNPDAIAVHAADRSLSYGMLDRASAALALELVAGGARTDRPIAVVMDKGWEQVVAVVGVLRAGAPYLPIDAASPPARVERLLALGEVDQIVTTDAAAAGLAGAGGRRVHRVGATRLDVAGGDRGVDARDLPVGRDTDLAYVIFTSGSTGTPKGVMIDHRGACNTVADVNARLGVGPGDAVLGLSSLSFDLSVYDVFGVLAAGGALVLPTAGQGRDPEAWLGAIRRHRVTVWNTVPALMQMLVEVAEARGETLPLRAALLSGDWIPVDLPSRIRALAPAAAVVSLGGATEASIWSIWYAIGAVDPAWRSIPYGTPMANQRFYVLRDDPALDLAPVGAIGQLYIGGAGVALGYWGDPERTAAQFVVHPVTGERLYRTGDLGQLRPDGVITFLGRTDGQVKVGGHRIELGEVEAALLSHPGVRDAVAAAPGGRGDRELVAYVVPNPGWFVDGGASDVPSDAAIRDPVERKVFTLGRPGQRGDLGDRSSVALVDAAPADRALALEVRAASFAATVGGAPLRREAVASLLGALADRELPGNAVPKRFYPSAGGLYPVQVYAGVGAGAVVGLPAGCGWFDPNGGRLVSTGVCATEGIRLHLVADLSAITPMYGELGPAFARVEAGHVAALLAAAAPDGVGIVWGPPDDDLVDVLRLGAAHLPLATLSVGPVPEESAARSTLSIVARKSYRAFAADPVSGRALAELVGQDPARVVARPGRVAGWPEPRGAAAEDVLGRLGPVASGAAFALVFDDGLDLATAGAIAQRWMMRATELGIGLCGIGAGADQPYAVVGGAVRPEQITALPAPADDGWRVALTAHVARLLPAHLVPKRLARLDAVPLSANGKVDRAALPALGAVDGDGPVPAAAACPPVTEAERAVVEAACHVLDRPMGTFGADASFFDLGGNSLLAVKLMLRLRDAHRRDVPLREVFRRPVLRELAAVASERPSADARPLAPIAPRFAPTLDEELL